jgi:GDP-mannose transporter
MSNKKNEDLEMSEMDEKEFGEREGFLLKASPHRRARIDSGMGSVLSQLENNPGAAVLAYCFSSISMTVVNKYVVSGSSWNLNFLYLAIQVCMRRDTPATTPRPCRLTLIRLGRYLHSCNSGLEADGGDR